MKKIITVIILLSIFFLVGCSKEEVLNSNETEQMIVEEKVSSNENETETIKLESETE